jgi:NAD(P)-dependent dehydrogenase (short-subunit alcohol dehydrogenase family)
MLWLHGVRIDWQRWHADAPCVRVPLPTYPFERSSHWLPEPEIPAALPAAPEQTSLQRFFVPAWRVAPIDQHADTVAPQAGECWLVLTDNEIGPSLARQLEQQGCVPIMVRPGPQYERGDAHQFSIAADLPADYTRLLQDLRVQGLQPSRLVHCWSLLGHEAVALTAESFWEQQKLGYFSLLYLAQALAQQEQPGRRSLVVATRGTYCISDGACNLANAPLTGLSKVMAQELSELRCVVLDLQGYDQDASHAQRALDAQRIRDEVLQGMHDPAVAYRGALRLVQTFDERHLSADVPSIRRLRERGVYVITGGLGKIGLALARRLAQSCQAQLVLLSRNAFADHSEWATLRDGDHAALAAKAAALLQIEALGSRVAVYQADVRSELHLEMALARAEAHMGPIAGVFHLAADMQHPSMHCPLTQLSQLDVEAQLGPKVEGFYALRTVLRRRRPDFVMLFSSNSSVLGGFGFAAYAAANAFLDHCANARSDQAFPWLCSNWDRWSDQPATDGERYVIGTDEGLDALLQLISRSPATQVIIATAALSERRERWVLQRQRPIAKPVDSPEQPASPATGRVLPRTELERTIAQVWQDVLGCDQVGVEDSFLDLGGDSLIGLRILSRLRELFQVEIQLQALLGPRPTVASLVLELVAELQRDALQLADDDQLSDEPDSRHRSARPSADSSRGLPR